MDQPQIQSLLEETAGEGVKVYFQPPENLKMEYPCVVYKRDLANVQFADNNPYRRNKRYSVTYIDRDPVSPVPDRIADLPMCTYERFFTAGNLNHDIFNIYF